MLSLSRTLLLLLSRLSSLGLGAALSPFLAFPLVSEHNLSDDAFLHLLLASGPEPDLDAFFPRQETEPAYRSL